MSQGKNDEERKTLTRPALGWTDTVCADIRWSPAQSRRFWEITRSADATYNYTLETLEKNRELKIKTHGQVKGGPRETSLQDLLTQWRRPGGPCAYGISAQVQRGALRQAHTARTLWERTQQEHAEAVLEAMEEGGLEDIPRRVQRAVVRQGPGVRKRTERDKEGRNGFWVVEGAKIVGAKEVWVPNVGVLEVNLKRGQKLDPTWDLRGLDIVERSPEKLLRSGRVAPEDRTFQVHLHRHVVNEELAGARWAVNMKGKRGLVLDREKALGNVGGLDYGITLPVVAYDGENVRVWTKEEADPGRAQYEKRKAKAGRVFRKGGRYAKRTSRRYAQARGWQAKGARKRKKTGENAACHIAKDVTKDITALADDGLEHENLRASAKGTQEKPGKNVKQKAGVSRELAAVAAGRISRKHKRCCEKNGAWHMEGNPNGTSITCARCGHRDKRNRKSQARFVCRVCGHTDNADANAAAVCRERGMSRLEAYHEAARKRAGGTGGPSETAQGDGVQGSGAAMRQPASPAAGGEEPPGLPGTEQRPRLSEPRSNGSQAESSV